jgi:tungstate transport system ATP-binding protein
MQTVGISEFADRNVKNLSGGEAQKVTLARALALQPEVLLMDEPFSHLDQESTEQLETLLLQQTKEQSMTVVLSTHDHLQGMVLADEGISLVSGRTVNAPLLNMFHGSVENHYFETGKTRIFLPEDIQSGKHIVVDPTEIVLSTSSLTSSMRNSFQGRVITISEDKGRVWVTIDACEKYHVQITRESLQEMSLNLGSDVWINFKSTSVKVF